MTRYLNVLRSYAWPVAGALLLVFLFSACKKSDLPDNTHQPVAGFMAFNLAPDKDAVGFTLSGNNPGSVLGYTSYTGAYLPIYTGTREVRSFDYNSGSTLAIANGTFKDSMYYSAFLLGINGNYRNVVVQDQLDTLAAASGKAWVRYVNAIPDSVSSPVVSIATGDGNTMNETAAYAHVSPFLQVNSGTVNVGVSNGGTISATRTITLEENRIYTVLLVGIPGQTDPATAVQVKFVQNGTLQ